MTNLPPSDCDRERPTERSAFDRLHPKVQRWVYSQRWQQLRDVQEQALSPILEGRDVIIAAATAGGKTQAAFLPIASALCEGLPTGVAVLDVCPLKALINDQYRRLKAFCETLDTPVHRWHGDVPSSASI